MKEIWKDIPGYEGVYEASTMGRVRKKGGYKACLTPHYYKGKRNGRVSLHKDGVQKLIRINSLVAATFLGPCPEGKEIYYLNGDTTDNRLANIQYASLAEMDFASLDPHEWKWIVGYEGLYAVSRYGQVRSMARRAGPRIIRGSILVQAPIRGYLTVTLTKKGVSLRKTVHRLVAEAFIPNPQKLPQINHKDENKNNNNADNLEWCDALYNLTYGTRIQRIVKKNSRAIEVIRQDGSVYGEYINSKSAGAHFHTRPHNVNRWANGSRRCPLGFTFRYKDNE